MHPRPFSLSSFGLALALAPAASAAAQDAIADDAPTTQAAPSPLPADTVIVIELVPASPPMIEAPATAYAPIAAAPPEVVAAAEEPLVEEELRDERPFSIGLSGLVGLRESGDDVMPTWTAGIDLAFRVMPWARLAVRRIGYGQASTIQGDRSALQASPAIDLFVPLAEWIEPFAEIGALVQTRFGDGGSRFGIAPCVGAGVRLAALDWLAFEIEGALHVPATEHVLVGHELFPTATLLLQLGAGAEARF